MIYICNVIKNKTTIKNRAATYKRLKIMTTFKELKSFCEKNNVRYEIVTIYSEPWINPFSLEEKRTVLGYRMGMNNIAGKRGKSEWQWVWFQTLLCDDELTDDSKMVFMHRYSMVNGKYYKGVMEYMKAIDTIERRS